jgi:glycosyltransferase involved in cell wall biosynthesis
MNLLEAMAMGLPVAALDVGDVRQMVAPANRGFVADAGDDAGFARMLAGLAGDAGRRSQLGRLNQGHVEVAYPWPRMVESYARIFAGRL